MKIDRLPFRRAAGANFGWPWLEGESCTGRTCAHGGGCTDPTFVAPIHTYDHGVGCAVIGGLVYRGCALPALSGQYLFADFCGEQVWSLRVDGHGRTVVRDWSALLPWGASGIRPRRIVSFARDALGEVLVVDNFGGVWKLVPDPPVDLDADGVVDACQGSSTVRTGSNPVQFLETRRAVLGGTWETTVDLAPQLGVASLVTFSLTGPLSPGMPGGFPLQGELLVQTPFVAPSVALGVHAIPVPPDTSLLGVAFSSQAAVVTSSRLVLTNALDVVLGL